MNKFRRSISGVLLASPLLVIALVLSLRAQTPQTLGVLPRSPESTGLLVAKAVHAGLIQPFYGATGANPGRASLSCSPAPCVLPNVQASGGGSPVNEDPVVSNPSNSQQLLSGGNDYNCFASLQGFYGSSDGGTTWTHSCLPTLPGGSGDGDPGVAYDSSGNAWASGIGVSSAGVLNIVVSKSTNNGATWGTDTLAVKPIYAGGECDKEWFQIDTSPTSKFPNAFYISNTQFDPSSNSSITVSHSYDGGVTWTTVNVDTKQIFPVVDQFSDLAIAKNGTVLVSWQRCTANGSSGDCGGTTATMMFSSSSDGGNTWTTPTVMASVKLTPDNCGAFYGCLPNTSERVSNIPSIDIDNSSGAHRGTIYAAMYNWTGSQMQVLVVRSTNHGLTWSTPRPVAPAGTKGDEFFQWLNVNPKGILGVSWLDRRNDPSNISYEAFAAASSTGGFTFGPNLQLTTTPSNPVHDGFGGGFMGDYTGNSWRGNTLFVSWMDTSNNVNAQDHVGGFIQ